MKRLTLLYLFVLLAAAQAFPQLNKGGFPCDDKDIVSGLRSLSELPQAVMPPADSADKETAECGGLKFAHKFEVNINLKEAGAKFSLADGSDVYRLSVKSAGAYSLNIIFSKFSLPEGARLFLYTPDKRQISGAFTSENASRSGRFAVAPLDGDELIVEYIEPAWRAFDGDVVIGSVNHDFLGLRARSNFGASRECEIDAACRDGFHDDQRRSACKILVDGTTFCSGNLVNNTAEDGTPYVLTASHCLFSRSKFQEDKAETCLFFFNYESPECNSFIEGSSEMCLSGATVIAARPERDMLLLRLDDIVPPDFMTYSAGWNATEDVTGPAYCFHHPSGDVKKVSEEKNNPETGSFTANGLFLNNGHWTVYRWESGISEGGSSGSGLFDASDRLVGSLSGGNVNLDCDVPGDDNFYKLSCVWNDEYFAKNNLQPWLDPINSGLKIIDGKETFDNPCQKLTNWSEEDNEDDGSDYACGHNSLGMKEFAERFVTNGKGYIYGLSFTPKRGRYSSAAKVFVRIYSGDSLPDKQIYEQELRITNRQYVARSESFTDKMKPSWLNCVNYFRFTEKQPVDSVFFVSFLVTDDVTENDTFALSCAADRDANRPNSAFFRIGEQWKSFEENPLVSAPSAIKMDVIFLKGEPDSLNVPELKKGYSRVNISPNPFSDIIYIYFPDKVTEAKVQITDYSGRVLHYETVTLEETKIHEIDANRFADKGALIVHIKSKLGDEYFKLIKR